MKMPLSAGAAAVYEALTRAGFRADVVGGCVRDFLLSEIPHDFDMTTSATPEEMEAALSDFRLVKTGLKHGTLTAIVNGEPIEVTTYRTDGGYVDHRHPENVTFTSDLHGDLCRRDFTVNAMCYHPVYGITDDFGGQKDLSDRVIRCVGEPTVRFREDALRILRALRFAAKLGFSVEEKTAKAIHELYPLLADISAERVYAEWKKLLVGEKAEEILKEFSDVFDFVFPGVPLTVPDTFKTDTFPLRSLELLFEANDRGKYFSDMCRRLKTEKSFAEYGMDILSAKPVGKNPEKGELLRLAFHLGKEKSRDFLLLSDRFDGGDRLLVFDALMAKNPPTQLKDLAVGGDEVCAAGYTGAAIGDALKRVLFAVMDGEVQNEKTAILGYLSHK